MATRQGAIDRALAGFADGTFVRTLTALIAIPSTSQDQAFAQYLPRYLLGGIGPILRRLGMEPAIHQNPINEAGPILTAQRIEAASLPTILMYGHGDTVRGQEGSWTGGRNPWKLRIEGDRWYGRGIADNKGQHLVNLAALAAVLEERGQLGFNLKLLIETAEECGSPGLEAFAIARQAELAADVLIASDGPRLHPDRPLLFLGARGVSNIRLNVNLRTGAHHSGNWGGVLPNAGTTLASAIASLVSERGEIRVAALRPPAPTAAASALVAGLVPGGGADGPTPDPEWGEPGLSPAERLYCWNTIEVLAMSCGDTQAPVNAIPGDAQAVIQLRHIAGTNVSDICGAIRAHLELQGFAMVKVSPERATDMEATRGDPDHPWVRRVASSITKTTGTPPDILPNLAGSLPNAVFTRILGMPTVWVPHSYASCCQHAPDEHVLVPVLRQGLALMTGLYWDLADG